MHTGKQGVLDGVSSVSDWSISESQATERIVASNTRGGSARTKGVKDWTGSYTAFGGKPAIVPGQIFDFKGQLFPTSGVEGGAGPGYEASALLEQIVINWNFETGAPITHTGTIGGNGELEYKTDLELLDESTLQKVSSCDTKIQLGAEGSETDWDGITTAALTLSVDPVTSAASGGGCWTKRAANAKNWGFTARLQNTDRGNVLLMPTKGSIVRMRCFINATEFWLLEWGMVREYTNIAVNRATGAIIGADVAIDMQGFNNGVVGKVSRPGADGDWFPDAIAE